MNAGTLAFVAVLCLGGAPTDARPGKPVFLRLDDVLRDAWLAAECDVLAVEVAPFGGRGANGRAAAAGSVRVRVTERPSRILCGFEHAGREIVLRPPTWGPHSCTAELAARLEAAGGFDDETDDETDDRPVVTRAFVVAHVDPKGGAARIYVVGDERLEAGSRRASIEWFGFCDFNACLIHVESASLRPPVFDGQTLAPARGGIRGAAVVAPWRGMCRFLSARRARHVVPIAEKLLTPLDLDAEVRVRGRVRELGADDPRARDRAEAALRSEQGAVRFIVAARERTHHVDVAAALDRVLAHLDEARATDAFARTVRRERPAERAAMLVEAGAAIDAALRSRLRQRLVALAGVAEPRVPIDARTADARAALAAWAEALGWGEIP